MPTRRWTCNSSHFPPLFRKFCAILLLSSSTSSAKPIWYGFCSNYMLRCESISRRRCCVCVNYTQHNTTPTSSSDRLSATQTTTTLALLVVLLLLVWPSSTTSTTKPYYYYYTTSSFALEMFWLCAARCCCFSFQRTISSTQHQNARKRILVGLKRAHRFGSGLRRFYFLRCCSSSRLLYISNVGVLCFVVVVTGAIIVCVESRRCLSKG